MGTRHRTSDTKTAIGYVRVSTQEQATEGVSLDAQRDRIRAYCNFHAIKLIDIKSDEGISGGTLTRPGLQAALEMIRRGRGNTLIVAKLDRLSRSLKDVCTLVEELFGGRALSPAVSLRHGQYPLGSGAHGVDESGQLQSVRERELISERTRAAACRPCRAGARNAQRRWFA